MKVARKEIALRAILGLAIVLTLYVLRFGPVWSLYKRGYVFSRSSIRLTYTPLVKVVDHHLCPIDLPGRLLWEYASWFAPPPSPRVLSADNTFD